MYTINPLFDIPVYANRVQDFDNIQSESLSVIEKLQGTNFFSKLRDADPNSHSLTDPTFKSNIIDDLNLVQLKAEIEKQVVEYMQTIGVRGIPKFKIFQSWMTHTATNEYTPTHDHALSDLSGVYYIKTNGQDGDLFFNCPNPAMVHSICFLHLPKKVRFAPEEGKIVIFPGWLQHGVEVNKTNDVRISISFNIAFERTV